MDHLSGYCALSVNSLNTMLTCCSCDSWPAFFFLCHFCCNLPILYIYCMTFQYWYGSWRSVVPLTWLQGQVETTSSQWRMTNSSHACICSGDPGQVLPEHANATMHTTKLIESSLKQLDFITKYICRYVVNADPMSQGWWATCVKVEVMRSRGLSTVPWWTPLGLVDGSRCVDLDSLPDNWTVVSQCVMPLLCRRRHPHLWSKWLKQTPSNRLVQPVSGVHRYSSSRAVQSRTSVPVTAKDRWSGRAPGLPLLWGHRWDGHTLQEAIVPWAQPSWCPGQ